MGISLGPEHLNELLGASTGPASAAIGSWAGLKKTPPQVEATLTRELRSALTLTRPQVLPGVKALLERLHTRIPLAVASNAPRSVLSHILELTELRPYFDSILGADDVSEPKPAPDLYLAAAAALGADPIQCIAFEDSPTGASAAAAAGMDLIIATHQPQDAFARAVDLSRRFPFFTPTLEDPGVPEVITHGVVKVGSSTMVFDAS